MGWFIFSPSHLLCSLFKVAKDYIKSWLSIENDRKVFFIFQHKQFTLFLQLNHPFWWRKASSIPIRWHKSSKDVPSTLSSSGAGFCGVVSSCWLIRRTTEKEGGCHSLSLSLPLVSPWNSPCLLPLPSYNPAAVASTHPLQHQQSPLLLIYSGLKPYSGAGFGSWSPPTLSPRASISSTLSSLKRDPGCPS